MTQHQIPDRCRIMLTYDIRRAIGAELFADIVQAGDLAGVILYDSMADFAGFQKQAEMLVGVIQDAHISAIIAGDSRIAARVRADGLHLEGSVEALQDAVKKYTPSMMVGYGNPRDRHNALEAGETQPDYLLFGKPGKDKKPAPHPRNLSLGRWWAELVEVPCIVQAGSDLDSILAVAATGAEFVALEEAVFAAQACAQQLYQANCLLDQHAPALGEEP